LKKDPRVFVEHILECIGLIERYTEDATKSQTTESRNWISPLSQKRERMRVSVACTASLRAEGSCKTMIIPSVFEGSLVGAPWRGSRVVHGPTYPTSLSLSFS
jgi:hypothetical protein